MSSHDFIYILHVLRDVGILHNIRILVTIIRLLAMLEFTKVVCMSPLFV